jgi:hypothetical protein
VQPCRSFNQALTVVEPGGEIVVQDSGGYSTGFTITQSVTIDAAGYNASVISNSGTDLCTINAGTTDRVVLRGISFHGAHVGGTAINVTQVGSLYVEHCSIAEFNGSGVSMPNGGNLFVTGTDVRACSRGIDLETGGATVANLVAHDSRITESGVYGVLLQSASTARARAWLTDCTASLCGFSGFQAVSEGAGNVEMELTNCRSFGNDRGIEAVTTSTGTARVGIANCEVTQNNIGIDTQFAQGVATVIATSPGTNRIARNYVADGVTGASDTLR